ncbi:LacI family DNA-binding transcriptional regulator [Clostridium sp. DL1XJH146]
MVTLKDIAKEANVSVMTVSRVVNGNYSKMSKETAKRIKKIIHERGYVPNYSARSLSSRISHLIAIITRKDGELNDPYTSKMLALIIPTLQSNGFYTMIACLDDFNDVNQHLRAWNAQGAIFLGLFDENIELIKQKNNIPLIFTDSYNKSNEISNVGIDDYKGGALAANHFLEYGHKNFAFISLSLEHSSVSKARLKGFTDTIKSANLSLPEENILDYDSPSILAGKIVNLKTPVTAIFTTADILALNMMDALQSLGYKVPDEYSFIGFDNLPISYYVTPKLTTISQNIEQKVHYICDILLKHIENPNLPYENILLDVELSKRNSVKNIIKLPQT